MILLPYFGNGDELHMCFNFPIMPRLFMAVAKGDRTPVIDVSDDDAGNSGELPVGGFPAQP